MNDLVDRAAAAAAELEFFVRLDESRGDGQAAMGTFFASRIHRYILPHFSTGCDFSADSTRRTARSADGQLLQRISAAEFNGRTARIELISDKSACFAVSSMPLKSRFLNCELISG